MYEFLVSSSSKAAGTVDRIRDVVLERGEQERAEFTFEPVNAAKRPVFQQVQEKTLRQVLGVIRRMPAAPSENVEWIPIEPAQLGQSGLPSLRLTLRRPHDDRPARGVKARRALRRRTMVAFHEELGLSPTIAGESMFRNKIPETLQPRRLCNGMKTLISDHDYELHLGGTAKPGIQKTLGCRGDLRNLCGRPRQRSDLDDEYFYRVALIALVDVDRGVAAFLSVHTARRCPRR